MGTAVGKNTEGIGGKLLGGWQISSFFTLQSGAPFTVLNGSDPTGALAGIDGLVGNAIRPNLNTDLDLSSMTSTRSCGRRRVAVPTALRQSEPDMRRRTRWATCRATRCAPTAW